MARLPAFDFVEHKNLAYLRIKSDQIVYAQHISSESGSEKNLNSAKNANQIIILPTDDLRMKLVVIPTTEVEKSANATNLLQSVQNILANLQVIESENSGGS